MKVTYKEDLQRRIQSWEQDILNDPKDEQAKRILRKLQTELALLERKEHLNQLEEDDPETYQFITSGVNINGK